MNLQNMAPNAKRSLLITVVFGAAAVCIYLFAVVPSEGELVRAKTELGEVQTRHEMMMRNLSGADKVKERLEGLNAGLEEFRAAVLAPSLESYAMGAKKLLDPLAAGAGLSETEYEELPLVALPVPKRLPVQLFARRPIRLVCRGSYQAAVSFLLRVEKEFPLVALQAMSITAQTDPLAQRVEFVFEWPVKGGRTKK